MHSTNYFDTFIEIAEDSPTSKGEIPPIKGEKRTVANYQFELLFENPYKYTSDEIFFAVHAERKAIPKNEWEEGRKVFFSKGQPCFRASPLTKRYGWGIHADGNGKIALVAADSKEYKQFLKDKSVAKTKAMRSKRAK